jgi:hypothetical protein
MPRISSTDSPRSRTAVKKIVENNTISVPDAMKISNFTTDEINDMTLKQRIRRAAAKAGDGQNPSYITVDPSTMSCVSTVTATPPLKTTLKRKNVRHSSAAAQQMRTNKLVDNERKKQATKYVTSLYANSRTATQLPGEKKLSAREVSGIVEKKFGIKVATRTIQWHVKEGRIGTSPQKRGHSGNFDYETVLKVSNAMESYIQIKQLNRCRRAKTS